MVDSSSAVTVAAIAATSKVMAVRSSASPGSYPLQRPAGPPTCGGGDVQRQYPTRPQTRQWPDQQQSEAPPLPSPGLGRFHVKPSRSLEEIARRSPDNREGSLD